MSSNREYAEMLRYAKDDLARASSVLDSARSAIQTVEEDGQISRPYTDGLREISEKLPELMQAIEKDVQAFEEMSKEDGGSEEQQQTTAAATQMQEV